MTFTKNDQVQIENLVRAMKKAKFELEGLEVLALADVFKWVNALHTNINEELRPKPVIPQPVTMPTDIDEPKKKKLKATKG